MMASSAAALPRDRPSSDRRAIILALHPGPLHNRHALGRQAVRVRPRMGLDPITQAWRGLLEPGPGQGARASLARGASRPMMHVVLSCAPHVDLNMCAEHVITTYAFGSAARWLFLAPGGILLYTQVYLATHVGLCTRGHTLHYTQHRGVGQPNPSFPITISPPWASSLQLWSRRPGPRARLIDKLASEDRRTAPPTTPPPPSPDPGIRARDRRVGTGGEEELSRHEKRQAGV